MKTKTKNVFLATAVAAVLLVAAVGSASAVPCSDAIGGPGSCLCGDTVVGDYTFAGNLGPCPNNAAGLYVGAHGITIDGAEWKITGTQNAVACAGATGNNPATHSGIANFGDFDDVVITDLEITQFCTGIALGNLNNMNVDLNLVKNCSIHDNGNPNVGSIHGIHMVATNNCTIRNSTICNNTGYYSGANCIFMYGMTDARGNDNLIKCNHCYNNSMNGVQLSEWCMNNTIRCNNLSDNVKSGIMLSVNSNENFVWYNIMSSNNHDGFQTDGNGNELLYNTISNNAVVGIYLAAGSSDAVNKNYVCGNGINILDHGAGNVGADNTGDTCPAGWCPFICAGSVPVYYDQDQDDDCSRNITYAQELLACGNSLEVGWCNHKGLFNANAATGDATDHCWGVCSWAPGNDPNDCNPGVISDNPVPSVPELATVVLFGVGLLMLVGYVGLRARRKQ